MRRPSSTSSSTAKRWTFKIARCLLAGAVMTWGVAWGFVLVAGTASGTVKYFHNPRGDPIVFLAETQAGVVRVTGMGRPGTFLGNYPERVNNYRGPVWWPAEAVTFNTGSDSFATAAGWPCLALTTWRTQWVEDLPEEPIWHDIDHYGIQLRARQPNGQLPTVLPLRPHWSGFALDTLLYGGVVLGVVERVGFARRRRREAKDRCPSCGYDRRGLAGDAVACPECGEASPAPRSTCAPGSGGVEDATPG